MYYIIETEKSFVFTENGATKIGLIKPVQMLASLSDDPAFGDIALEVEEKTIQRANDAGKTGESL